MRRFCMWALTGFCQGFFFVTGERVALLVVNVWHDHEARKHPFPGSGEPIEYTDTKPPYYDLWR